MDRGKEKTAGPAGEQREQDPAASHAWADSEDICRCKKISVMTPRQLLGTMLRDLSFWKKTKDR